VDRADAKLMLSRMGLITIRTAVARESRGVSLSYIVISNHSNYTVSQLVSLSLLAVKALDPFPRALICILGMR